MPTKNPRLNVTLGPDMMGALTSLAKHEHKSLSNLAKELIFEAFDKREDKALSKIAEKRDIRGKKMITHHNAWK